MRGFSLCLLASCVAPHVREVDGWIVAVGSDSTFINDQHGHVNPVPGVLGDTGDLIKVQCTLYPDGKFHFELPR